MLKLYLQHVDYVQCVHCQLKESHISPVFLSLLQLLLSRLSISVTNLAPLLCSASPSSVLNRRSAGDFQSRACMESLTHPVAAMPLDLAEFGSLAGTPFRPFPLSSIVHLVGSVHADMPTDSLWRVSYMYWVGCHVKYQSIPLFEVVKNNWCHVLLHKCLTFLLELSW